jgi:hypothetical protein
MGEIDGAELYKLRVPHSSPLLRRVGLHNACRTIFDLLLCDAIYLTCSSPRLRVSAVKSSSI